MTAHSPAGEVVLAYLREQVAAISRYDPLVRRDEPDAVHQMRVATRRARSVLQAFGQVIDWNATRPLCAELKWLAPLAGRQAARTKELQQLLGDHHDSVVARIVLLDLAGQARAAGEDTFTYGVMHQRLACQAAESERALSDDCNDCAVGLLGS